MSSTRTRQIAAILLIYVSSVQAAWGSDWSAGVARTKVPPTEVMWMGGYASRTRAAEGKLTDLWVKALALRDGNGECALLLTADLIGVDREFSLFSKRHSEETQPASCRPLLELLPHSQRARGRQRLGSATTAR